jgi:Flp pilus assembly protein TadD
MWIKPARPATAQAALAFAAAVMIAMSASSPAHAGLFGGRKSDAKAEAKKAEADAAKPRKATAQERQTADRLDPLARVAFWSREMQVDPTDAEAGVKLAAGLRQLGRFDEAAVIAGQVLVSQPDNVEALLEDARAKIGGGQPFYAIQPLQKAQAAAPNDWRPVSLLGVAYGQTERPEEAREAFAAALKLSPENPAVLANLALFHAARGDKDQAEMLLRRAVANPAAGARERQNLALILGLQGKLAEAERLLRQDLPPEIAAANLAYLKGAPAESRTWGGLGSPQ